MRFRGIASEPGRSAFATIGKRIAYSAVETCCMSEFGWKYLTRSDRDAILQGIREGRAVGGPYHAEIHPADRCNIECFFCSTAAIRGTDEIPTSRFEELLDELKTAGTRSIRLSGGGEPLFHRQIKPVLAAIARSGIPIENLTTNAVILGDEIASLLVDCCDQVTVSLNTIDPESWSSMMQSPPKNYERVLENVRRLDRLRKARRSATPAITIQFLVWKENYRDIPRMYDLATSLGADAILFNGLSSLPPEKRMSEVEKNEMLALYEQLIRQDEYRRIASIESYETDISPQLAEIHDRLGRERAARSAISRLWRLATRRDFTIREKIAHNLRIRRTREIQRGTEGLDDACIIGWHSLLIRPSGEVAPCCILQHRRLGNVYQQSLAEVWNGEAYEQFRAELRRIMDEGTSWQHDPDSDRTVDGKCGIGGECPIRSFYYRPDVEFFKKMAGRAK